MAQLLEPPCRTRTHGGVAGVSGQPLPLCRSGRQPFRYAPERPTTGKVRVARDSPEISGIATEFPFLRTGLTRAS
jgi:hypothetical protein